MIFEEYFNRRVKNKFLALNLQSLVLGLIIGLVLIVMFTILDGKLSTRRIVITSFVSYMITASIANTIYIAKRLIENKFKFIWSGVIIYYAALVIGMLIGTESTLFLVNKFYNKNYEFLSRPDDLKFNLFLAFVIGTIIYINQLQRENIEYKLKQNEGDLNRLRALKNEAELKLLESKINPHFLYNSLNSIASLVHHNPDKAEEMTVKLSKLFRYSINSSNENFNTIEKEIEMLNTYLDIEKIRFSERLDVLFDVSEDIHALKIPRFILQPLAENAIKHGISKVIEKGLMVISIKKDSDRIILEVKDNGSSFDNNFKPGYGLQSIYDKLNLLYHDNYDVQIANNGMTSVKINIPLEV